MADRGLPAVYDGRIMSFAGRAFNGDKTISAEIYIIVDGRLVLGKRGGGQIGGFLLRPFGENDFKPILHLADAYADCGLFAFAATHQTDKQVDARRKINFSDKGFKKAALS